MNLRVFRFKIFRGFKAFIIVSIVFGLFSCGKSDDIIDEKKPPEEIKEESELFYKLTRVNNLPGSQANNFQTAAPNIYYSLESNKALGQEHLQTRNWDIAFGGLVNSFISGNNGKDPQNHGYGNTAEGGILLVEKEFDQVVDIPDDKEFQTRKDRYGTDNYGMFGEGIGWYLYDFNGDLLRDGSHQFQHVVYPMNQPWKLNNGRTSTPRTAVIRTAKGNYAKLRILSLYKDRLDSTGWRRDAPKVYITFDYVLVPKNSKKFEIKK